MKRFRVTKLKAIAEGKLWTGGGGGSFNQGPSGDGGSLNQGPSGGGRGAASFNEGPGASSHDLVAAAMAAGDTGGGSGSGGRGGKESFAQTPPVLGRGMSFSETAPDRHAPALGRGTSFAQPHPGAPPVGRGGSFNQGPSGGGGNFNQGPPDQRPGGGGGGSFSSGVPANPPPRPNSGAFRATASSGGSFAHAPPLQHGGGGGGMPPQGAPPQFQQQQQQQQQQHQQRSPSMSQAPYQYDGSQYGGGGGSQAPTNVDSSQTASRGSRTSSATAAGAAAANQPPEVNPRPTPFSVSSKKGTDATGALRSIHGMWQLFDDQETAVKAALGTGGTAAGQGSEGGEDDGTTNPLRDRQPSAASAAASEKSGKGGKSSVVGVVVPPGGGLPTRMVDHHSASRSAAPGQNAEAKRQVAMTRLEESLSQDTEDDGVDPEDLMRLANRLIAQRQFEAALPYTMRAARRYEKRDGRHDPDTMLAVMLAAKLLRRLGHSEKAIQYFGTLLNIQEALLGVDHAEVANTASALGQLFGATGMPGADPDRAATCFHQVRPTVVLFSHIYIYIDK